MSFYEEMQGVASELLQEFDQGGMALSVHTAGGGPAHNPGPATYVDRPFPGTARGVSAEHLKDTAVLSSDLVVIMPGTMAPKMTDRMIVGGLTYIIVKISAKPATGVAAAYEVIVRK